MRLARVAGFNAVPYRPRRSLDFVAASSQYLTRTFAAGNRRTWSFACWFKRIGVITRQQLFVQRAADNPGFDLEFQSDNTIGIFSSGDSGALNKTTNSRYANTTFWRHLLLAVDTTQATAANRFRLYIDGAEVINWWNNTIPAQNYDTGLNRNVEHTIGRRPSTDYLDGLLADVLFVDGAQLIPANVLSGVAPRRYYGALRTNGFWLPFYDPTSTTTLGRDDGVGEPGFGAGSNDWTLNGMSTSNSKVDVPGGSSTRRNVFNSFNSIDTGGWVNFTLVMPVPVASILVPPGTPGNVRITLRAGSVEGFQITDCYIGHRAGSGDVYDFAATPTRVTFSGGSNGFTLSAGNEKPSDVIPFAWDKTSGITVAVDFHSTNTNDTAAQDNSGVRAGDNYYKTPTGDAATVNKSGYTTHSAFVMLDEIEMDGF